MALRALFFSVRSSIMNAKVVQRPPIHWRLFSKSMTPEEKMMTILNKAFPQAKSVEVIDVSGGCGAMYEIYVEAPQFKGLSIVKQHRLVTDALKEEIKNMHGLRISTNFDVRE